jgi:hypothetical protein
MSMGCAVCLTGRTNSRDSLWKYLSRIFAEFDAIAEIQDELRLEDCRLIATWVAWCATPTLGGGW